MTSRNVGPGAPAANTAAPTASEPSIAAMVTWFARTPECARVATMGLSRFWKAGFAA